MVDRGTKRKCASCGISYYDLNRSPITCPKCAAAYVPVAPVRATRKTAPPARVAVVELEEPVADAEEEVEEAAVEDEFEETEDLPTDDDTFVAPGDEDHDRD